MTARDYFREQADEINGDSDAANGPRRKKKKKGGQVKGLTAHHRMDRHVRRQVGGGAGMLPQQVAPATLGAAGAPGIGGGMPAGAGAGIGGIGGIGGMGGGAGLPTGAGMLARPGGAGVVPQMPLGAGAIPRAEVGTANPLGGAAGMPVGGAGMGAGLGGAGLGAGVRPPGMQRGGRTRMPPKQIPQGKVLSQPRNDYDVGGSTHYYGDPRGLTPRYAEEQHDALNGRYIPPEMNDIPPDQPYRHAPSPDEARHPPVRRGSEPPLPMQPQAEGGMVRTRAHRRYAPGPRSAPPFGQVMPRDIHDVPSQLSYDEPPDPNGMAQDPPLRQGSAMPPMARGGRLPAALEKEKYNGRKPPQRRQGGGGVDPDVEPRSFPPRFDPADLAAPRGVMRGSVPIVGNYPSQPFPDDYSITRGAGDVRFNPGEVPRRQGGGGVRVPRMAVGERYGGVGTPALGRGVGGTGLGVPAIGGGGISPTRAIPRSPSPLASNRMMAGVGPARFADGGEVKPPRRQRGGRAPADMEDHSQRQAGGRTADSALRSQGYQIVQPPQSTWATDGIPSRALRYPDRSEEGLAPGEPLPASPGELEPPPGRRRAGGDVDDGLGGRYGTRADDRWGQKWAQPFGGVENTRRVDRSRGHYLRENRMPPGSMGPDDNTADYTMKDGGRLTAQERRNIPSSEYALPGKGKGLGGKGPGSYPLPDEGHARSALSLVSQHGTPAEKSRVRAAVRSKFPGISQGKSGGGRSC